MKFKGKVMFKKYCVSLLSSLFIFCILFSNNGQTESLKNVYDFQFESINGSNIKMEDFKDKVSEVEYNISGICQKCQDNIFG